MRRNPHFILYFSFCITCLTISAVASAQLCTPPLLELSTINNNEARPQDNSTYIYADSFITDNQDNLDLQGNVKLLRKDDSLLSENILINNDQLILNSPLQYFSNNEQITAQSARIQQNTDQATFTDAEIFERETNATFNANSIQQLNATERQLRQIRYTRCEPDKRYWEMRAASLTLNDDTGRGVAKHASLRLFGVPFFYLPILSFPIDDRRATGFLYPAFNDSSSSGSEINIPYYWNIHPQADATFNLRSMSKRGEQLSSEWRLLTKQTNNLLYTENLDDELFGDDRSLYYLNHQGKFGQWQSRVTAIDLADAEHIDDLASDNVGSDNYLKNVVQLDRNSANWRFSAKTQTYEFADSSANESDAPYQLLPQLRLINTQSIADSRTVFTSELTQFEHETKTDTGGRWVNKFDLINNFSQAYGYIKPHITIHTTQYELDNNLDTSRTIPITGIDSGLFFDRYTENYQQTLEPRLFLLYVPYEDQSDLPDFDTSDISESYNSLFSRNRFSGSDRIGDAELASIGLTSRFYQRQSNQEYIRLQIGQSFYFDDQQVNLSGTTIDDREKSAVFTRANWQFAHNWQLRHDVQWPNAENDTEDSRFSIQYRRSNDQLFYFSYNYDNADLDQVDLNGRYRISPQWVVLGKYQYDFEQQQNIQKFAGFEYENCCLAVRIVGQTILQDNEQENNLTLQLSLKGLSTIGDLDSDITDGINGFTDNF